jgi:hypothetical protein
MGVSGQHHALTPGKGSLGTHCTGGWVGLRAGLDTEARGKILCLCRGSNPNFLVMRVLDYSIKHMLRFFSPDNRDFTVPVVLTFRDTSFCSQGSCMGSHDPLHKL